MVKGLIFLLALFLLGCTATNEPSLGNGPPLGGTPTEVNATLAPTPIVGTVSFQYLADRRSTIPKPSDLPGRTKLWIYEGGSYEANHDAGRQLDTLQQAIIHLLDEANSLTPTEEYQSTHTSYIIYLRNMQMAIDTGRTALARDFVDFMLDTQPRYDEDRNRVGLTYREWIAHWQLHSPGTAQ